HIRLPESVRKSRVLIVGGAGVAGRNTAAALTKFCPDLHIVIAGRNREKGGRVVATLGDNSEFAQVDIEDVNSLHAAMTDVDVVVHAAGPFEYADCNVLEAAIQTKTAYIDVCDHEGYSRRAKSYKNKAMAAGVPAITNGGFNPGVSNLMAAMLVDDAKSESRGRPEKLRFNYFTAGSGGTGPGVLGTTFYLMADEAVTYHKGAKVKSKPYTDMLNTDFGEGIGKKERWQVLTRFLEYRISVLRFGTAPFFPNWTLSAMIKILPTEILKNKNIVQMLVQLSYPMIRAVDVISGENASIK
ncbi:hypothetical protein MIMGU_mgv1a0243421mg, partial [Erythranthe guttata]